MIEVIKKQDEKYIYKGREALKRKIYISIIKVLVYYALNRPCNINGKILFLMPKYVKHIKFYF